MKMVCFLIFSLRLVKHKSNLKLFYCSYIGEFIPSVSLFISINAFSRNKYRNRFFYTIEGARKEILPINKWRSFCLAYYRPELRAILESPLFNISYTEFGISIEVRAEHPQKAPRPIFVTVLGIVTDLSRKQP